MAASVIAEKIENELKTAYKVYLSNHNFSQAYVEHINTSSNVSTRYSGFVEVILETGSQKFVNYLYVIIDDNDKEVQITQATLPQKLQNKGLTSGIIKETFQIATKYDYKTTVGNITNSRFYNALVNRKALPYSRSCVHIVNVNSF